MISGKKYDVVCLGVLVSDILIKGVRDDIMDCVEHMTESISLNTGGDALNEAVTCSRLGLKTALVGNLGADFFGDYIVNVLKKENISAEGITFFSDCQTAVNVALIGSEGKRCILTAPVTNMNRMELTEKGAAVLRETELICIGSLFVSRSLDAEMVQEIYRTAGETGAVTVADASFRDPTEWVDVDPYSWIDGVDYFLPSYEEGSRITGKKEPEDIARELLSHVKKAVILKLGAEGSLVCSHEGDMYRVPAFSVDVVDTTGAGDNFVAGFLWGLKQKLSLRECCLRATAVGGMATTGVGANGAVKSAEQMELFLKEKGIL